MHLRERHIRLSDVQAYAVSHEPDSSQSNGVVTLGDGSPRSVREPQTSDAAVAAEAYNAVVVTSEPKILEQRVAGLEEWKRSLPEALDRRDREVVARLETRLQGDLDASRRSVQAQVMEVSEYLEGGLQSATVSYWVRLPCLQG